MLLIKSIPDEEVVRMRIRVFKGNTVGINL